MQKPACGTLGHSSVHFTDQNMVLDTAQEGITIGCRWTSKGKGNAVQLHALRGP